MPRKDLSLYVHIPFCEKKCNYCAFNSFVTTREVMEEYLSALKKEITIRAKELGAKYQLKTVYIGGGTPSILEGADIKSLLRHINKEFLVKADGEITIEINPNSITEEKAKAYLAAGINRFSVGLQSAEPHLLKMLGRLHSAADFASCVRTLKAAGAENISADIILGLPKQTVEEALSTVDYAARQGVTHISTYLLELEEGTKLTRLVNANMLKPLTDAESIKIYHEVNKRLTSLGFHAYELSNYAINEAAESKHNKVYWQRGEYLGVGLGSHSYTGGFRYANTSKLDEYLKYLNAGQIPLDYKDEITKEEAKEEIIMLSLRTKEGLNTDQLKTETGYDILSSKKEEIKSLIKEGYMLISGNNKLTLTEKGYMVINKIVNDLI